MNIREQVDEIRREAWNELSPDRAVLLLSRLSSLLASASDEWIHAEMQYNRVYENATDVLEKVTEARAKSKATVEYEEKLKKEAQLEVIREMINSIKYLVKVRLDEMRESKNL